MRKIILAAIAVLVAAFGTSAFRGQPIMMSGGAGGGGGGGGGGGIACAVGPNYQGTIPPIANAAGFTTCVLNMDFSDSTNFTYSGVTGVSWTNLATWLDCKGASTPIFRLDTGDNAVCADFTIVTDTDGKSALQVSLTQADYNAHNNTFNTLDQADTSWMFPNSIYWEDTRRIDTGTLNNPPTPGGLSPGMQINAPFYGAAIHGFKIGTNRNWIEWDPAEWYLRNPAANTYSNLGIGETTNDGGCPGIPQHCSLNGAGTTYNTSVVDFSTYHAAGFRVTSDTSGNLGFCWSRDGTRVSIGSSNGCALDAYRGASGPASDVAATNLNYMTIPYNNSDSGSPFTTFPVPATTFDRRILVFSCSTWKTTPCNTGVVTTNP